MPSFWLARIPEIFRILDPVDDADKEDASTLLIECHIVVVMTGVDSVIVYHLSIQICRREFQQGISRCEEVQSVPVLWIVHKSFTSQAYKLY